MSKFDNILIYLDSNIIIGYYIDYTKHPAVKDVFDNAVSGIQLLTSRWTLTEIIKVLIKNYNWTQDETYKFIYKISTQRKIGKNEFELIKVSPDCDYSFDDFFFEIDKELLEIKSSVGDSIHARIMRNNGLKHILTLNKKDFQQFSRFIVLEPNELIEYIKNQQTKNVSEETDQRIEGFEDRNEVKDTLIVEQVSEEEAKEMLYEVKIDNNRVKRGQDITSSAQFIGKIQNGFFDHYITDLGGNKIGWNWDKKTLINSNPTTPGTLSGNIKVKSSWKLSTLNLKIGEYIIEPRVYEHNIITNKRKIIAKSDTIKFEII